MRLALLLAGALGAPAAGFLSAEEAKQPSVRANALSETAGATALTAAPMPEGASDLLDRLRAARASALSPDHPAPQSSPESASAAAPAPLTARIGRDVTVVPRPGIGTPMQIRGALLQESVAAAAPGEDLRLATARTFLRANRRVLGLDDPDNELALRQRLGDELGLEHLKFEQRYRGLSVWPAELIVHVDRQGAVYLLDGAFVLTPRLATTAPIVTADAAVQRARAETPGGEKAHVAAPELIVYAANMQRPARLAWRLEVSTGPEDTAYVVIDAINGVRLASIPLVMTENVPGSGRDLLNTIVSLNVWHEGTTFVLIDTSKPMFHNGCNVDDLKQNCGGIYVDDANHTPPNSSPNTNQATVSPVTSTSATAWSPADAVSAAANFSKVYDYYNQRHSRNSIDGNGGNILAITRLGVNYQNAFWTDSINGMYFGDADLYAGSLDVVGHEMTHGVTSHTAGLVYQDQSGALNEAMSDIFGEMVENFASGPNDWIIGSRLHTPIRNMANPAQFGDPATMSQYNNTTSDHGGVHTNSGIINHAYYLLVQGETGAIGRSDAERIFYRALTMHLTKNSQFLDARLAAIQSADEIFGAGSNQSQRTAQAFDGVEILGATPAPPPPQGPPVSSADSTLFLAKNGTILTLSRRETAQGDPAAGVFLPFTRAAAQEKLAISGDGTIGFFTTADNDACFFRTDGSGSLGCLALPGTIASVAMSRDTNIYAFVLLSGGQRENLIRVIDLPHNTTNTFALVAPATESGTVGTVAYADTLDLTANKRFLFYDALNVVTLTGGGGQVGLWSISAVDFSTGQTYSIIPPLPGVDIGNPSVARTSDNFFTFEADNQSDGKAAIYAGNFQTGLLKQVVVNVPSGQVSPAYTGDDRGIVYSYPDTSAPTGRSLAIEALAADHVTPSGAPSQYLFDGAYPIIYRRGVYTAPAPNCAANATTLCLSSGRFQVTATFTTSAGQQGIAQAVSLTTDTGYFTFFDPSNVEVVVKVLNACTQNQRIWVFAGGLTNVATVITVTDTATGVSKIYSNAQQVSFQPVQDTAAFGTCFAGSIRADSGGAIDESALARDAWRDVARLARAAAPANAPRAAEAPTACVQDAQTLCLSNNRYQVRTTWRSPNGQNGNGNAVRLTADTGYFWFFSSTNVEMVVKVLNACSLNSRFWVFAGGLTNVQVTTTVTDTQTGQVKVYNNALNQAFQPLQDTGAFATCP